MARDLNSVFVVGRLTGNPEFKMTASGKELLKCRIANNRSKEPNDANFFDLALWGKTAAALKDYLVKGKQIAVTGRLQYDSWESDGKRNSRVVIVGENVQLLGGGEPYGTKASGEGYATPAGNPDPGVAPEVERHPDNDDIPF
jgi:single-strand DNA-binding protein